jgi:hypothetical protein
VARLKLAGSTDALNNVSSQGAFKEQIAALTDLIRQVTGNANVAAGSGESIDPLTAPFTLYVNPYIGTDEFAAGSYNTHESSGTDEERIAQKLKRLESQRLVCGYTPHRPFKTINRAAIEAAIITSKNWYTYTDPRAHLDCVSIVLSSGLHIVYNNPGNDVAAVAVEAWANGKIPTWQELIAFNPNTGGLLLPRGCSMYGPDLRKVTLRPSFVPTAADELADYSNRRSILKVTGTGFFFGMTFMDKVGLNSSHHLLDCFHFGSEADLDQFYAKVFTACGSGGNLSEALTVTRGTEYEIVGPITGLPTSAWDTTASASPYIFNCSIRSDYGIGGIFADGSKAGGLKSMVTAQFTGVSLQKDMSCWQVFAGGVWRAPNDYAEYISTSPDNVRMKPQRVSRHISAIKDAFIQEVSVFAIGQGIHHYTDLGGECTITNSNSSFGGCAAISRGYKSAAFPSDDNWTIGRIKVPLDVSAKAGNIRKISLGNISVLETSPHRITLSAALEPGTLASVPALLEQGGYTFRQNTYLWIENPAGPDWRVLLPANAWSSAAPTIINLSAQPTRADDNSLLDVVTAAGNRLFLRRVVDTRTNEQRRCSLELNNTASARIPERSFILQTDPLRPGGAISRLLSATDEILIVTDTGVGPTPGGGVIRTAEVTVRRGASSPTYSQNSYYPVGTTVLFGNKHYRANSSNYAPDSAPALPLWTETFVHMEETYKAEDPLTEQAPSIVFDTDTDAAEGSATLGINWSTIWTSSGPVRDVYRSGTDYLGCYALLRAMGLNDANAHNALVPRVEASRRRDPSSAGDFPVAPAGGAATGRGNWAVEFRRPSIIRLYGHAWEWAGWLNYSKSIPAAQQGLSAFNKFTYYFTNVLGGRVVPQGSNEDGFNVTPRGLEDVESGTQVALNSLDSVEIDTPTSFSNLTIDNLTVSGTLDLSGVSSATLDIGLFPYLPFVGDPTAEVVMGRLAVGQGLEAGYEFCLNGAQKANAVALASGAVDCRQGNFFTRTVASNITFTFTNPPATGTYFMVVQVTYTAGTVTWPASVRWPDGLAPLIDAGVQAFFFYTANNGTTWRGATLDYIT